MSRPPETIIKALKRELPLGSRLLIAVSGGIDSVCLLHATQKISRLKKFHLEIAHVDHGLREESSNDREFVEELSKDTELRCHVLKVSKPPQGVNIEAWARKLRYGYFSKVLSEAGLDFVVTAHTANDVAETLLMKLISNKEPSSIMRYDLQRKCIRPLLQVSRKEIEAYAQKCKLNYCEDKTNFDVKLLRNRVRHVLIPLLKKEFEPRIVEVLSRRSGAIATDISYLYSLVEPALSRVNVHEFGSSLWLTQIVLDLKTLQDPLKWRLAEMLFKPKLGFKLGREKSSLLVEVLLGKLKSLKLPGGLLVKCEKGGRLLIKTS